jgi:molybdenum storage protein
MGVERKDIESRLKGESLLRKKLMEETESYAPIVRMIPDLNIVKIGGHSLVDRGRKVLLPLIETIGELSKKHKILVVAGGGTRARHALAIGLDLGMPVGILHKILKNTSEQNATMIAVLLMKYNGIRIEDINLPMLPHYFQQNITPVIPGTPPYSFYEHPPKTGRIPPHRTDTGAYLLAEVHGARKCILLKDVDGVYRENPLINPNAEFFPRIGAEELLKMDLEDLPVEHGVLKLLRRAHLVKEVIVTNAFNPQNLIDAIEGKSVGTTIFS